MKQEAQQDIDYVKDWLQAGSVNIFGMPFSGKDTQAKALSVLLDAAMIGGGEILRSSPDKEYVARLSATGELFPTEYYLGVILPYLSRPNFAGKPLVLSSVGRWIGEEGPVIDAAAKAGHPIKAAVFLNISEDELFSRWRETSAQNDRGTRHDDAEHLIEVRLEEFRSKTLPVLDVYRSKGLFVEVDGIGDTETVTGRIIAYLKTYAGQK